MNIRYCVDLSEAERCELQALLSGGKHAARTLKRAQILLAADAGVCDEIVATTVAVGASTVYRTKRRFVEGNLERALNEEPRPGAARKLSGKDEASPGCIALASPGGGLALKTPAVVDAAVQALAAQDPDFDLGHVQPAGMLGG